MIAERTAAAYEQVRSASRRDLIALVDGRAGYDPADVA